MMQAMFTPCVFVTDEGRVWVDWGESFQNALNKETDELHDDLGSDHLPDVVRAIIDAVDAIVAGGDVNALASLAEAARDGGQPLPVDSYMP
jgi:hypothetical protein